LKSSGVKKFDLPVSHLLLSKLQRASEAFSASSRPYHGLTSILELYINALVGSHRVFLFPEGLALERDGLEEPPLLWPVLVGRQKKKT